MKNKKENIIIRTHRKLMQNKLIIKILNIKDYIFSLIEKSIRFELIAVFGICFLAAFAVYSFVDTRLTEYVQTTSISYDYDAIKQSAQNILQKIVEMEENQVKEQKAQESQIQNPENNSEEDIPNEDGLESQEGTNGDTTNENGDGGVSTENPTGDLEESKEEEMIVDSQVFETEFGRRVQDMLYSISSSSRIYITNLDGVIKYSVRGEALEKVDIFNILEKMNTTIDENNKGDEITYLYPLTINGERSYFLYTDRPEAEISYGEYVSRNPFVALLVAVTTFIIMFVVITNKKMKYIEEISKGLEVISKGELTYKIDVRGKDEITNLANNINYMAMEINDKMQAERRAEQSKGELITNVSHDLRTPLTSVM